MAIRTKQGITNWSFSIKMAEIRESFACLRYMAYCVQDVFSYGLYISQCLALNAVYY